MSYPEKTETKNKSYMREAKSVYIQKVFFFLNFGNQLSDEVYNLVEQTVFKIKKKIKGKYFIKTGAEQTWTSTKFRVWIKCRGGVSVLC